VLSGVRICSGEERFEADGSVTALSVLQQKQLSCFFG
jgi:hypothetical protein